MYELVKRYNSDLDNVYIQRRGRHIPLSSLPLDDYFDVVRNIPYKMDKRPIEVVMRPKYVFQYGPRIGADCKKKAIAIGAFAAYHGIPYRFIGSSRRPDKKIHHVFPQLLLSGDWKNVDATYPEYELFMAKKATKAEVL